MARVVRVAKAARVTRVARVPGVAKVAKVARVARPCIQQVCRDIELTENNTAGGKNIALMSNM